MARHNRPAVRCTAIRYETGEQCKAYAIRGGTVCVKHGVNSRVAALAAVRFELTKWTLGDPVDDPGETLLRLITQSKHRLDLLDAEIDRAVTAAGGDLTAALIGDEINERGLKTGEYVRALFRQENEERDRCANFCRLAIAANIGERQAKAAEVLIGLVGDGIRRALAGAGLDPEQQSEVIGGLTRELRLVAGGPARTN